MISLGCGEAHLRMIVEKYGIHHKIDVHLKSKSKGIAVDGVSCKEELENLLGVSSIVFFCERILPSFKMVRRLKEGVLLIWNCVSWTRCICFI